MEPKRITVPADVRETVRDALVLMHRGAKDMDFEDACGVQERVFKAWQVLEMPGKPWEK
jgi:hypothetical protein